MPNEIRKKQAESTAGSRTACDLCGLENAAHAFEKMLGGRAYRFCCPGCLHVFEILTNMEDGPPADFKETAVYRQSVAAGIIPDSGKAPKTARQNPASSPEADNPLGVDLDLQVEGMWCTACAWLVEQVLAGCDGVLAARVHFLSDSARIRYLPYRTGEDDLIGRIAALGYRAHRFAQAGEKDGRHREMVFRLGIAAILTLNTMMISFALYYGFIEPIEAHGVRYLSWPLLLMATPVVFYCGWPILRRAASGLRYTTASMDTLIAAGALCAYAYSVYQMTQNSLHLYFDTASMLITLVLLGKFIESTARERVSAGITALYRLAGQKVRLIGSEGGLERWVAPDAVGESTRYGVHAEEQVPLDGAVVSGRATLDLSALTGESRPVGAGPGDRVMAGSRVIDGELVLQSIGTAAESALHRMIRLMQDALNRKDTVEITADRITRYVVPAVLLLAAATAAWLLHGRASTETALLRAVTVLVITCPCALGIATPLAKVAALGVGRSAGILIRNPAALQQFEHLDTLVFDKTGTLTRGDFTLREIRVNGVSESALLQKAAAIEACSDHFLAREIVRCAARTGISPVRAESHREIEGLGIMGEVGGEDIAAGNRDLMVHARIEVPRSWEKRALRYEGNGDTVVFCAIGEKFAGLLIFGDTIREEAPALVAALKAWGHDVWLVSGDSKTTTGAVARSLGIDRFVGNALPDEKVDILRRLQSEGRTVAMLGDGINDAAVLAAADVALALGAGERLLQDVSDITIAAENPGLLIDTLRLADLTGRTVRWNLFFAFLYNVLAIPLAVFGFLNPFIAVLAMFASSLTVIGNTLRISRFRPASLGHKPVDVRPV